MSVERGPEQTPIPPERAPIPVRLGEPFKLPSLDLKFGRPGLVRGGKEVLHESVDLDVEGIGQGEVQIVQLVSGHYAPEPATIPFSLKVVLEDLPREKIERVTCSMKYQGKSFVGTGTYVDSFLREDGASDLNFSEWKAEDERWEDPLALPSRAGVFDDIEFVIDQADEVVPDRMEPEPPNFADFGGDVEAYEQAVLEHGFSKLHKLREKVRERLDQDLQDWRKPTPRGQERVQKAIERQKRFLERHKPMFDEMRRARKEHQAAKEQKLADFGPELTEIIKDLARRRAGRDYEVEHNEDMLIEAFDRYFNLPKDQT